MIVLKFGGKSLSTKQKIIDICKYIALVSSNKKVVVVVSAMGSTTDELLQISKKYAGEHVNLREQDALISTGETQSASIMSIMLCSIGIKAISMQGWQIELSTKGMHGQSIITGINKSIILEKLKSHNVVVVAGFQGVNSNGDVTTLGRGGSDTTAVALGAVLSCEVEIFSDFDGVYMGDPRDLNFKKFIEIDYEAMQRLANNGAKVLSSTSVDMAKQADVPVVCKQSSNPQKTGTHITNVPKPYFSITCKDDLCEISILSSANSENIQGTAKYIVNNVNYYKISIKNNKIVLLININDKSNILQKVAELNNLLEDNND